MLVWSGAGCGNAAHTRLLVKPVSLPGLVGVDGLSENAGLGFRNKPVAAAAHQKAFVRLTG